MCDDTDPEDWEPFYFLNLARFPWIDNREELFARMESCPNCTETQVRLIEPREMNVIDDRRADGSPDIESTEEEPDPWHESGQSGRDLEQPD